MRRHSSSAITTPRVEQTTPSTVSSSVQNKEPAEENTTYRMRREELIQDIFNTEPASEMPSFS